MQRVKRWKRQKGAGSGFNASFFLDDASRRTLQTIYEGQYYKNVARRLMSGAWLSLLAVAGLAASTARAAAIVVNRATRASVNLSSAQRVDYILVKKALLRMAFRKVRISECNARDKRGSYFERAR